MVDIEKTGSVKESGKEEQVIFKAILLGDSEITKIVKDTEVHSSQPQPNQDKRATFPLNKIANPTFDIDLWASLVNISTRLGQSIRIYSKNTVGIGWDVMPVTSLGSEVKPELLERFKYEKAQLEDLLLSPNADTPFSDIMTMLMFDKLLIGNGYMEIVRNVSNNIIGLYHVKGTSVRVLKDNTGYVQVRGGTVRYFKKFGDLRYMDKVTGEIGSKKIPLDKRATEILHFKEYSTTDDYYGVPRYQSSCLAILGNRAAAERNHAFFTNDAVPRMALLISGGKLSSESTDLVQKFFTKSKGTENAHRMMLIQLDTEGSSAFASQAKPTIELKPLTVGETDDASFQKYRNANDEEIREAFGIAKAFFSPEDVNKAVALATKAITNEQEFDPTQDSIEHIFYHTIIMNMFSKKYSIQRGKRKDIVKMAMKYLPNDELEKIKQNYFSEMFNEFKDVSLDEMIENEECVISIIEKTGLYKFIEKKIKTDSKSKSIELLVFESKPLVKLSFQRPKTTDEMDMSQIHERYLKNGAMTPNEVRIELGMDSYPDKINFGDTPLPVYELQGAIETEGTLPEGGQVKDKPKEKNND